MKMRASAAFPTSGLAAVGGFFSSLNGFFCFWFVSFSFFFSFCGGCRIASGPWASRRSNNESLSTRPSQFSPSSDSSFLKSLAFKARSSCIFSCTSGGSSVGSLALACSSGVPSSWPKDKSLRPSVSRSSTKDSRSTRPAVERPKLSSCARSSRTRKPCISLMRWSNSDMSSTFSWTPWRAIVRRRCHDELVAAMVRLAVDIASRHHALPLLSFLAAGAG
mmetsp:Transcript_39614/g.73883  ORF Transcript_39614/g.73883 Transcript_39614/m.73883 type:complete len:220 (-) Transcript_39614:103-762(-)